MCILNPNKEQGTRSTRKAVKWVGNQTNWKVMKNILRKVVIMLVGALTIGLICTSCTPEEIESFKKGYHAGSTGDYSDFL